MLNLENILTQTEIDRIQNTRNLTTESKAVNFIAQTLNSIPWTYEWAVHLSAERDKDDVESPLKTILITSWLCHSVSQGKLTYKGKPIRLKMNDYLAHHFWSFSFPSEHYSMCVESLYIFYQGTNNLEENFLSPDQLRVYPALKSTNPNLKGRQASYVKVREQICNRVEDVFSQHELCLPSLPKSYDSLRSEDVNDWFNSILCVNSVDSIQVSQEISDHVALIQSVSQKYFSQPKKSVKDTQPVWISF